jgi:hypothetical protein
MVAFGAAAIAAVGYAPSWVDRRQSPEVALSAHVVTCLTVTGKGVRGGKSRPAR